MSTAISNIVGPHQIILAAVHGIWYVQSIEENPFKQIFFISLKVFSINALFNSCFHLWHTHSWFQNHLKEHTFAANGTGQYHKWFNTAYSNAFDSAFTWQGHTELHQCIYLSTYNFHLRPILQLGVCIAHMRALYRR